MRQSICVWESYVKRITLTCLASTLFFLLLGIQCEVSEAGILDQLRQKNACPLLPPPVELSQTEVAAQAAELSELADHVDANTPTPDGIRDRATADRDQVAVWAELRRRAGGRDNLAKTLSAYAFLVDIALKVHDTDMVGTESVHLAAALHEAQCPPAAFALLNIVERGTRSRPDSDKQKTEHLQHLLQVKSGLLVADQDYFTAEPLFTELEQLIRQSGPFHQKDELLVGTLINHSVLERRLGRFSSAQELTLQALQLAESKFGKDSDQAAFALTELTLVYGASDPTIDLNPMHDRIVANRLKLRGENSLDTALVLSNRAQYRRFAENAQGADEDYRHAIVVMKNSGRGSDIEMAEGGALTNPPKFFYHVNHQGSVIAMTDAGGNLTQQLAYDEYGNLTPLQSQAATNGEPFRFTGRRFDPETGLYYYRARYFSPALGRFLQTDPIGKEMTSTSMPMSTTIH